MEFVYAFLIIVLFFALAPMMQSKKRAETQKILAKKLEEAEFETTYVINAGEMALYVDEKNNKWFWRKNRLDIFPDIYTNEMLGGFEFLENGNIVAKADAGMTPKEKMFEKYNDKLPVRRRDTVESFDLLIRLKGSRHNDIIVNFLENSISYRSHQYRKVLQSAKEIAAALIKIQGSQKF